MLKKMTALLRDEEGQGLVEYGLILALISVAAIASIKLIGPKISTLFSGASTALE